MKNLEKPCAEKIVKIYNKDKPLSCPSPNQTLWSAHPRVYLKFDKENKAICPYCKTKFILDLNHHEK